MSLLKRFNSWEWRRRLHASWYPELARFPSPKLAGDVYRRVGLRAYQSLAIAVPSLVLARIFDNMAARTVGPLGGTIVGIAIYFASFLLCVRMLSRRTRVKLRQALVECGVGICIPCGYDLRGLTEPRCPECGTPFDSALLDNNTENGETSPTKEMDDEASAMPGR